jgi:peptidoglycan hydrolase-like protein with peptidoglycan-binding domain
MQGLRNQISALQAQLQAKDDEVSSLRESLSKLEEQQREVTAKVVSKKKVIGEVKERPTAKQIQIALKNAGYDPGAIDGKIGRQTRDAIESFQKANNLHTDGKVGKKTWALLRDYLYKQVK